MDWEDPRAATGQTTEQTSLGTQPGFATGVRVEGGVSREGKKPDACLEQITWRSGETGASTNQEAGGRPRGNNHQRPEGKRWGLNPGAAKDRRGTDIGADQEEKAAGPLWEEGVGKSRVPAFPSLGPQWEGSVDKFTSQESAVTCNSSQASKVLSKPPRVSRGALPSVRRSAPKPSLSHPPLG